MLKFVEYQQTGTIENLGVLSSMAEGLAFIPRNFRDESKRVCVVVRNAEGLTTTVTCSASVSKSARKAKADGKSDDEIKAAMLNLVVLENEEGAHYLGTEGGALEFTKTEVLSKTAITWEELIA